MSIVTIFVLVVFVFSLVSRRLEQTVITPPIVFTTAGLALGFVLPIANEFTLNRDALLRFAEIALVLVLFTDAMGVNLRVLRSNESLPARLLGIGMPLTVILGAIAGALIFPQISFWEAGILASVLAPTDAGLGEVVVTNPRVPPRIRQALNVEAGLNDGLSVPFLFLFLTIAQAGTEGAGQVFVKYVVEQLGFGTLIGLGIGLGGGWLLAKCKQLGWMDMRLQRFAVLALPLLCMALSEPLGASIFIASFVAGLAAQVTLGRAGEESADFAVDIGELLDFFVFFLFGIIVTLAIGQLTLADLLYALVSLTVVRMLPVAVAVAGLRLQTATVLFMGWFGPRGLASIVLGLVYLAQEAHLPGEQVIIAAVTVTVLVSIYAHGISAVPGINLYVRSISGLGASAAENAEVSSKGTLEHTA